MRMQGVSRQMWRYLKESRTQLIFAVLSALLSGVLLLIGPLLIGYALDYIVGPGQVDFAKVGGFLLILVCLYVISALGQWLTSSLASLIAANTARTLREEAFERLSRLSVRYYDNHAHGDLINRITVDADAVGEGLSQGITQLFTGVVSLLGTMVFMLSLSGLVTLAMVVITPLSVLIARFIVKRSNNMFLRQSELLGEMNGYIEEIITNERIVRAYGYEARSEQLFGSVNGQLHTVGRKAQFYSSLTNPSTRLISNASYMLVGTLSALLAVSGGLSVGAVASLLSYSLQFARPINQITSVTTHLQSAVASARRLFEMIAQQELEPDTGEKEQPPRTRKVVFENVGFGYTKDKPLIRNFNLTVQPGQSVAIVGPTGAGKTTLVNLLMRFYEIDEGAIRLDDTDIRDLKMSALRNTFSMVLQDTWLFHGTIAQNIAYGKPQATKQEIIEAAKSAYAHGFIRRLQNGYDTLVEQDGENLSAGQRQLVCIARAMLHDRPILILDEATSNVDTRTEQRIQRAFAQLMQGKTSFVIAHRLSTIRHADVILVLKDGDVVEQGDHETLLSQKGFYAHLYESQFEAARGGETL